MYFFVRYIFILIFLFLSPVLFAQTPSASADWFKVYYNENGLKRLDARLVSEIDSVYYNLSVPEYSIGPNLNNKSDTVLNLRITDNKGFSRIIPVDSITSMELGANIPTLYIDTDPYVDEIPNKTDYVNASFRYIPYGDGTDTVVSEVSIRGRGNSSWYYPKKPYRLKFDKKQSIGCLNKAKSFVLISPYIDNTLIKNAVAYKIAELLEMSFTNKPQFVNLVFNGRQRGNYMLTNKPGINSGSVDIEESNGILWELDISFDEDFQFHSLVNGLPCMVKDPDLLDLSGGDIEKAASRFDFWREDLESAFRAVKNGEWLEAFDMDALIKYLLVFDITHNQEFGWPKSVYLYKESPDSKYKFGPIWDFDWALGYCFGSEVNLLNNGSTTFSAFSEVFHDGEFLKRFGELFDDFYNNHLDKLMEYIDECAALVRDSALQDALIWPQIEFDEEALFERNTSKFDENIDRLKTWLIKRIEYIKTHPAFALYDYE